MAGITWTKEWAGTDDGTTVGGADLGNMQSDLGIVLTTADLGVTVKAYSDPGDLIFYENAAVAYEGNAVYV